MRLYRLCEEPNATKSSRERLPITGAGDLLRPSRGIQSPIWVPLTIHDFALPSLGGK